MIQRIQTIYLVLGAVALLSIFLFDSLWAAPSVDAVGWMEPVLLVLVVALALGAVGTIFLYADRKRQRGVVVALQYGTLLLLAVLVVGLYAFADLRLATEEGVNVGLAAAVAMPFLAYVLFYLARRGIDHDINLVRSMDRLR